MSEHNLQVAIIQWARLYQSKWPELELLHAIPNGGYRNAREARRLKKEGVLAGIPDLCLPVPRGDYHGLYMELKYGRNRLTKSQLYITNKLSMAGYFMAICYEFEHAISTITEYLEFPII